jgi:predicted DsbA family dithiol-disulfide isomerase
VRLAHAFAMENDEIRADMVEASEFPQLSIKYGVQGVPQTVVNETHMIVGAVPEKQFLEKLLEIEKGQSLTE